jgi:hypothetical protein
MPKPSDELTDKQLHEALARGEFQGRDALIAQEILRRRHEDRATSADINSGGWGSQLLPCGFG